MKVVVNKCFGGFGLSHKAIVRYHELKGNKLSWATYDYKTKKFSLFNVEPSESMMGPTYFLDQEIGVNPKWDDNVKSWYCHDLERTDPYLVQVVEELGEDADNWASELEIVEIPEDVKWYIDDYDGIETIREEHRSW